MSFQTSLFISQHVCPEALSVLAALFMPPLAVSTVFLQWLKKYIRVREDDSQQVSVTLIQFL